MLLLVTQVTGAGGLMVAELIRPSLMKPLMT